MHRASKWDQIAPVLGHNSVDYVDECVTENMVDNLVLLEKLEQD